MFCNGLVKYFTVLHVQSSVSFASEFALVERQALCHAATCTETRNFFLPLFYLFP